MALFGIRPTIAALSGLALLVLICPLVDTSARAADKINFQDHVLPILRNRCLKCHNPDGAKADLDLSSQSSILLGGSSGEVVVPGDPDSSRLFLLVSHQEEPKMPPNSPKMPQPELDAIRAWIAGGLLENAGGKAMASKRPTMDLALTSAPIGKPAGPAPMPHDLLLEPLIRTSRPNAIRAIASSPWGPLLAIAGQKQIFLYHSQTNELLGVLPFAPGEPLVLKFSRNGSLLLAGGGQAGKSGTVVLYDVATGKQIGQLGEEYDSVLAADISADQSLIALGGPGKLVKVYTTSDGSLVRSIKKHTDWICALEFSPDGVLLATGDRSAGLHVWESFSGNLFYTLDGHKGVINDVSWRGDSNVLASASADGTIKLWEMRSGKQVKSWTAHAGGVEAVEFTHDGRLASCGRDRVAKAWDQGGKQIRVFEAFGDYATQVTFDHDGTRLVGGDFSGEVRVWQATDGKRIANLSVNPPAIAERIEVANKQLAQAEAAQKEAAKAVQQAEAASQETAADLAAAQKGAAEAKSAYEAAQIGIEKAKRQVETAQAVLTKAQQNLQAKEGVAKTVAAAQRDAKAALEKASSELKAKKEQPQAQAIKRASDALAQAQAANQKAVSDLAASKSALTEATAGVQMAKTALEAANAALPKLKAAREAAAQAVPAKVQAAKVAAENLAKTNGAAEGTNASLAAAKAQRNHWLAAATNVQRQHALAALAAVQAEHKEIAELVEQSKQDVARITAELEAAKKLLAEGPALVKAKSDLVAQAKQKVEQAALALQAAKTVSVEKTALVKQATDLCTKLTTAATKDITNQALAQSAVKAKESLDLLAADSDSANKLVAARTDQLTGPTTDLQKAEKALAETQAQLARLPKQIEKLTARLTEAREIHQADLADLADAAKPVAAAKQKVDQLAAQYAQLRQ